PVEQAMTSDGLRGRRNLVVAQAACLLGKGKRQIAARGTRGFLNGLRCSHRFLSSSARPRGRGDPVSAKQPNLPWGAGVRLRGNERNPSSLTPPRFQREAH